MYTKAFLLGLVSVISAKMDEDYSPHEYCERLCRENHECRHDPHSHGSYCKLDHHPRTCFGFYKKKHHHGGKDDDKQDKDEDKRQRYCFQPNDKHCDDSKLEPVLCEKRKDRD